MVVGIVVVAGTAVVGVVAAVGTATEPASSPKNQNKNAGV
jgi:hypothetical protein